jgi:hypothetical protein
MVINPVPGDLTVTSPWAAFLKHSEKYNITIICCILQYYFLPYYSLNSVENGLLLFYV